MRDSQYKSCAVQNQFTAYLIAAIRNYKRTYLRRISTALRTELPMEGHSEVMELCEETDFFCGLPLMQRLENERLFAAMQGLSERERYIFLSKVLGEMSLSEIALSLGITYGAAAMSYPPSLRRWQDTHVLDLLDISKKSQGCTERTPISCMVNGFRASASCAKTALYRVCLSTPYFLQSFPIMRLAF